MATAQRNSEFTRTAAKFFTRGHIFWYRMTGGFIGSGFGKVRMLLLTTKGRKSGKTWTTPLSYVSDGDAYVVVASFGGSPQHPAWYLNLEANPTAEIQVGSRVMNVSAETAGPDDRARLWRKAVEMYPGYEGYQERTERQIPLVILHPE
jgi:deazaflavin-dependent oxidoreductase (nitroreductase family)